MRLSLHQIPNLYSSTLYSFESIYVTSRPIEIEQDLMAHAKAKLVHDREAAVGAASICPSPSTPC